MLKQPDYCDFIVAMSKEIEDHTACGHWKIRKRSECNNPKIILAIWSFKQKRYPDSSLNKHKACLCAHGGTQQWGVHFWETYAPVVNWMTVRLVLIVALIHELPARSIDFVLAFPQADLDVPIFMKLPPGIDPKIGSRGDDVIKLKKSLYGLQQAGLNWYEKLKAGLLVREYIPSKVDPCLFSSKDTIVLVYVDDVILVSKSEQSILDLINLLQEGKENFDFTDKGDIKNYLGVEFSRSRDGSMDMKQEFLVDRIVKAMDFKVRID